MTSSFVSSRGDIQNWNIINVVQCWWQVVCLCAVSVCLRSWLQECIARQRNVILGSIVLIGISLLTICNYFFLILNPINQNSDLKTVTFYCHSLPRPYRGFTNTLRHATVGRTPLDAWSARRRDLYLTTHNTHNRQTSMPPVGFEPTISVRERPQTHVLDLPATGI